MKVNAALRWLSDPAKAIKELKAAQKKATGKAIRAAIKPVKSAVKSEAKAIKRYGFLAKSIGTKVKVYRTSVAGIVGPRSKLTYTHGTGDNPRIIRPSKYAHLVEKGTNRSRARPFLGPSLVRTERQFLESVARGIKANMNT